jgi:glycosyltransferase involved in cell wall biosynthesis
LFTSIIKLVSNQQSVKKVNLPYSGASPLSIFKNLISVKKTPKNLYHITGDVTYMGLVLGKQSIITIHDIGSALQGNAVSRIIKKLIWFQLPAKRVRYITVISEFTKSELSKLIPNSKNKIRVIPNPVGSEFKLSPYTFNAECPTILFVGTKPNKNLERVVVALNGINCNLKIIGPLNDLQKQLLEEHRINYSNKSKLSRSEIVQAYIDCDVLCFPSTYEGFGMPIIEAQATGRPVITSNLGAMKEVARQSACLVNPFEVESIRNGIIKVIGNVEYRKNLIDKGLINTKRFSLETITQAYLELYKSMV